MTEDQKYEIAVLAEDYENKRQRWYCLGALNTAGKTATERTKMSVDFHIAHAEMLESWGRLKAAEARLLVKHRD